MRSEETLHLFVNVSPPNVASNQDRVSINPHNKEFVWCAKITSKFSETFSKFWVKYCHLLFLVLPLGRFYL